MNKIEGPTTGIKTDAAKARQYPRIGKVRIGIKGKSASGKEIPKSVDYFVPTGDYAHIFTEAFGEKPTEITIVFPPAPDGDISQIINHFYRSYKGSKLFCMGDGETAKRSDGKGKMEVRKCPCELLNNEKKSCSERLNISFIIPQIPILGVWEFSTGSVHSRISVFSGIDLTKAFAGNIVGIPFKLKVEFRTGAIHGSQNKFPVITITPLASTEQLLQMADMDPKTRFNTALLGKSAPQIEKKDDPKEIAAPEEHAEIIEEEPAPEKMGTTDISDGEINQAIVANMVDLSPLRRRELKVEHLGTESISDCEDKNMKIKFLQFLQKQ